MQGMYAPVVFDHAVPGFWRAYAAAAESFCKVSQLQQGGHDTASPGFESTGFSDVGEGAKALWDAAGSGTASATDLKGFTKVGAARSYPVQRPLW